ncbi:bifunctional sugar-1-phosphate nucleotidylyltransferase/acetyltransferase [Stetteria hydrogenophila]
MVLLAAGRGERLEPLTETRPKPLMPILGEPVACRQLRLALEATGAREVVVVYSSHTRRVTEELARCAGGGVELEFVDQGAPLGTGHAVLRAVEETGVDDVLVVYSDLYLARSAVEAVRAMRPPSILVGETDRPWEYGVVRVEDGLVAGLEEKPGRERAPPRAKVFLGVAALRAEDVEALKSLKPSPRGEYELTDLLAGIARRGELAAVELPEPGAWRDIGRPWDLLEANRAELERVEPRVEGEVHPTAVLEGPVVVEEGAVVGPHTVVEGPAYIARGAAVGPGAHVRPYTVILEGARVGFASEVKASLVMEHARIPHLNYVGDSIVGEHANLGAGTVTANLRFDRGTVKMTVRGARVDTGLRKLGAVIGGYAQTGVNVSIMPGVKIGSHAVVYPGCVVYRDVPRGGVFKCGGPSSG